MARELNRNDEVSPEVHFHIRWESGAFDWERHNTREEAEAAAKQLSAPNEKHTVEEHNGTCAECQAGPYPAKRAAG